jgi:electron transport complex protein RnfC
MGGSFIEIECQRSKITPNLQRDYIIMRSGRFRGGIKFSVPPDGRSRPFEELSAPSMVIVPLQQDQGGVCTSKVKKNDAVLVGQPLGESPTLSGASIHAPISGKVTEVIKSFRGIHGQTIPAVTIESDGLAQRFEHQPDNDPFAALQGAGVVDFDRKTIPLATKLAEAKARNATTLIVNALDMEPVLASRGRLLQERPQEIAAGMDVVKKMLDLSRVVLTVDAADRPANASAAAVLGDSVQILPLRNRYPQAMECLLAKSVLNVEAPFAKGVRMPDIGAVVVSVESMAAVGRNQPVVERFISVANGQGHITNIRVAIGTPIRTVLEHCGISPEHGGKILAGGPMTGLAVANPDQPVTKEFSGIFVQRPSEVVEPAEAVCIKCGLCVDACPMRLMPFLISGFSEKGMYTEAQQYDIFTCIECGCCAYLCPVRIPMVQYIQFAKKQLRDQRKGE